MRRTAAECRKLLASLDLNVVLEKDATAGHEYLVEDMGGTLFRGFHEGNKTDALNAVLAIPEIAERLAERTVSP